MVSGLFGGKAHIDLKTDKPSYTLGEEVHATVHIHTDKDLNIRGGTIRLGYTVHQEDRRRERNYDDHGSHTTTVDETDTVDIGSQEVVPDGVLGEGTDRTAEAKFSLPPDALPSGRGNLIRVDWWLKANLDIPHALDPKGELHLTVAAPVSAYQGWARQAPKCSDQVCTMTFTLPAHEIQPGETITGKLAVQASEDVSSSGIRIDLLRTEVVGGSSSSWGLLMNDVIGATPIGVGSWQSEVGNHETKTVATVELPGSDHIAAGIRQEMPFRLAVPPDAIPTMNTPRGQVRWLLKASVNRRMRSDYTLAEEVIVYGAGGPGS